MPWHFGLGAMFDLAIIRKQAHVPPCDTVTSKQVVDRFSCYLNKKKHAWAVVYFTPFHFKIYTLVNSFYSVPIGKLIIISKVTILKNKKIVCTIQHFFYHWDSKRSTTNLSKKWISLHAPYEVLNKISHTIQNVKAIRLAKEFWAPFFGEQRPVVDTRESNEHLMGEMANRTDRKEQGKWSRAPLASLPAKSKQYGGTSPTRTLAAPSGR